jgi:phosphoketolase
LAWARERLGARKLAALGHRVVNGGMRHSQPASVTPELLSELLHLNGYKIANPTILARIPRDELERLLVGYGYKPRFVEGDDPATMHQLTAATLDTVLTEIASIQRQPATGVTSLVHNGR